MVAHRHKVVAMALRLMTAATMVLRKAAIMETGLRKDRINSRVVLKGDKVISKVDIAALRHRHLRRHANQAATANNKKTPGAIRGGIVRERPVPFSDHTLKVKTAPTFTGGGCFLLWTEVSQVLSNGHLNVECSHMFVNKSSNKRGKHIEPINTLSRTTQLE